MCYGFLHTLPVIAILLVVAYTYYVYVYELCVLVIPEDYKMAVYLCVYHLLLIPFLVMYFITMCHKQWQVPREFRFSSSFYDKMSRASSDDAEYSMLVSFCKTKDIRVFTRNSSGSIRVCHTCRLIKPDRTHHCSTCEACVLKMDHHCPWVNNCIGFTNYKYFLITVLYGAILCSYYFGTSLEYALDFFMELGQSPNYRRVNIVISTIIVLILAIALWCLLGFHISLILHNETTVEALHPPTFASAIIYGFDRGAHENFHEVCTWNVCCWILPVQTQRGNGVSFDVMRYR